MLAPGQAVLQTTASRSPVLRPGTTSSGGSGIVGVPCSSRAPSRTRTGTRRRKGLFDPVRVTSPITNCRVPASRGLQQLHHPVRLRRCCSTTSTTGSRSPRRSRWKPAADTAARLKGTASTRPPAPASCPARRRSIRATRAARSGGHPYDASTCSGNIVTPNFQAALRQLWCVRRTDGARAVTQMTYQASNKLTLRMTAANLYITCFGGTKAAVDQRPVPAASWLLVRNSGRVHRELLQPGRQRPAVREELVRRRSSETCSNRRTAVKPIRSNCSSRRRCVSSGKQQRVARARPGLVPGLVLSIRSGRGRPDRRAGRYRSCAARTRPSASSRAAATRRSGFR